LKVGSELQVISGLHVREDWHANWSCESLVGTLGSDKMHYSVLKSG
jgi:hypothetical protein